MKGFLKFLKKLFQVKICQGLMWTDQNTNQWCRWWSWLKPLKKKDIGLLTGQPYYRRNNYHLFNFSFKYIVYNLQQSNLSEIGSREIRKIGWIDWLRRLTWYLMMMMMMARGQCWMFILRHSIQSDYFNANCIPAMVNTQKRWNTAYGNGRLKVFRWNWISCLELKANPKGEFKCPLASNDRNNFENPLHNDLLIDTWSNCRKKKKKNQKPWKFMKLSLLNKNFWAQTFHVFLSLCKISNIFHSRQIPVACWSCMISLHSNALQKPD